MILRKDPQAKVVFHSGIDDKKKILGGKIGTGRKGIDFTQTHTQFSKLIQKGLV